MRTRAAPTKSTLTRQIQAYARNGFIPLKYAYVDSAAETHARLSREAGYNSVAWSASSAIHALAKSREKFARMKIAELGPGTGRQTSAFLK